MKVGYGVEVSGSNRRLVDFIEAWEVLPPTFDRPALIVVDANVLKVEPTTVVERLGHAVGVPLLVLAGSGRDSGSELERLGVDAILTTPFLLDDFVGVVSGLAGSPMQR